MIKVKPITVKRSGIWLNLYTPTIVVAIIHKPANDAYVMPTGIVFITIDNVNIHPTIVIAVNKLGINNVKPFAPLANPFAAVPKITAIIRTMYAKILLTT